MDKRKPKLFNTRAIVMKDGFPCGDKAVYSPSLFKFNSLAIRAMPFERAIYSIVLKRNSISFSSRAASRYAITSSFVSISSAGSYLLTFTFPILFCTLVFQLFEPLHIGFCPAYVHHSCIVDYNIQNFKSKVYR